MTVTLTNHVKSLKRHREFDVDEVLATLSVSEKISLLGGADFWHTVGIPKKGVPSLRFSDGPNGVRGILFQNGTPSNCYPCAVGIAAAWDDDFAAEVGHHLANEAKAKNVHVVLGPTLNIQRSPLGGRGFESFSEDPVLCGRLAGAYVRGMQANGAAASPKHFVCNDQEFERQSSDSVVPLRALREIYLEPFRIMQRIGKPRAYMTGYNRVNDLHVSENKFLLQQVLREEWGFDGAVMSDWTGVYSCAASIKAGLDIEMPGPPVFRGNQVVRQLNSGKLAEHDLDPRVRSILGLIKFAVDSGRGFELSESVLEDEETKAFLRRAASEAVVLLSNDKQLLPIKQGVQKIALIGQSAKIAVPSGGGSASLRTSYLTSPLDAISLAAEEIGADVAWALGAGANLFVPLATPFLAGPSGREAQITLEVWKNDNVPGAEWLTSLAPATSAPDHFKNDLKDAFVMILEDELPGAAVDEQWSRCTMTFIPDRSGDWEISFGSSGFCNLFLDGKLLIDNSSEYKPGDMFFMLGSTERRAIARSLTQGQSYTLEVRGRFRFCEGGTIQLPFAIRLGASMIVDEMQLIQDAADLAATGDLAIVMVGLNGDFESEGLDRPDMEIPGRQNDLVKAILAANPNTIVVNQSGMAVHMPWVGQAHTLVQAFYGGNDVGTGIADVLFGKVNPSGRMPVSFPKRLIDCPASLGYGMHTTNPGRVIYNEGIHVGYRYYESFDVPVAFAFGHGLSYTTYAYSNLRVSPISARGDFDVKVDVSNTGGLTGKEVVQVYIRDLVSSSIRPSIELKGYTKLLLKPGETKTASIELDRDALKFYDEQRNWWIAEKGDFEVCVGPMLKDLRERQVITLEKSLTWTREMD